MTEIFQQCENNYAFFFYFKHKILSDCCILNTCMEIFFGRGQMILFSILGGFKPPWTPLSYVYGKEVESLKSRMPRLET